MPCHNVTEMMPYDKDRILRVSPNGTGTEPWHQRDHFNPCVLKVFDITLCLPFCLSRFMFVLFPLFDSRDLLLSVVSLAFAFVFIFFFSRSVSLCSPFSFASSFRSSFLSLLFLRCCVDLGGCKKTHNCLSSIRMFWIVQSPHFSVVCVWVIWSSFDLFHLTCRSPDPGCETVS